MGSSAQVSITEVPSVQQTFVKFRLDMPCIPDTTETSRRRTHETLEGIVEKIDKFLMSATSPLSARLP
jgi:hypothetical protein